jgi:hypothetical protein
MWNLIKISERSEEIAPIKAREQSERATLIKVSARSDETIPIKVPECNERN